MSNAWLNKAEVEEIRKEQQELVEKHKYNMVNFDPIYVTALAQVLNNQRNLTVDSLAMKVFSLFEGTPSGGLTTIMPKKVNVIGLRNDFRTIVLEDDKETVWAVKPIERELKAKWWWDEWADIKIPTNMTAFLTLLNIVSVEIGTDIVKEVNRDLNLYCGNDILQYNYCIHSFRLGEKDESGDQPIYLKYIKTATFGD